MLGGKLRKLKNYLRTRYIKLMSVLKYDLSVDAAILFRNSADSEQFIESCDIEVCRIVDMCKTSRTIVVLVRTTEQEYTCLKLIYGEDVWQR